MFSLQFLQPFSLLHLSANRLRAPKQKPVNSPISNCDLLLEENHYGANKQHAPQTCCIPGLDFGWSHLLHVEFLQLIQRGLGVQPCTKYKWKTATVRKKTGSLNPALCRFITLWRHLQYDLAFTVQHSPQTWSPKLDYSEIKLMSCQYNWGWEMQNLLWQTSPSYTTRESWATGVCTWRHSRSRGRSIARWVRSIAGWILESCVFNSSASHLVLSGSAIRWLSL